MTYQRFKEGVETAVSGTILFGIIPSAATYVLNAIEASNWSPDKVGQHTFSNFGGSLLAYGLTIGAEIGLAYLGINGPTWSERRREKELGRLRENMNLLRRSGRI